MITIYLFIGILFTAGMDRYEQNNNIQVNYPILEHILTILLYPYYIGYAVSRIINFRIVVDFSNEEKIDDENEKEGA